MKFVPVVNCPCCNMPYTSAQLGFPFCVGSKYTVVCSFNDNRDRKVGCGSAFDFQVVEVEDKKTEARIIPKAGLLNKILGKTETIAEEVVTGTHLEVRAKARGA